MQFISQLSFNAGEISPQAENRVDLQKYQYGCKTLENFQISPYGPVEYRPGTHYVGRAADHSKKAFLERFVYSDTTSFVIAFSENTIRFLSNDTIVTTSNATTAGSWSSGVVTLTIGTHTAEIGDEITVAGVTPSAYNGTYIVTAKAATTVSYALTSDPGTYSAHGTVAFPYEIASTYTEAECFELSTHQINDVVYIAHPDHKVAKLTRVADNSWTLADVDWDYPPFLDENITDITMTASHTTGSSRTLTASAAYFTSDMVGSYFEVKHLVDPTSAILATDATSGTSTSGSASIQKGGEWKVTTSGYWNGILNLQRSTDNGTTWIDILEWRSASNRNIATSGIEDISCLLRLKFQSLGDPLAAGLWESGSLPTGGDEVIKSNATLEASESYVGGFVEVTNVGSSTVATVEVKERLHTTTATKYWSECAFSDEQGHPRAVGFIDGSLVFGGTITKPKTLWKSAVDDYEDFEWGTNDDDAVTVTLTGNRNPIEWLVEDSGKLHIGTIGEQITLSGAGVDSPWTPTSVKVATSSNVGSARTQGIKINDTLVFLQRSTKKLRRLGFDFSEDRQKTSDLTRFANQITGDGVTDIAVSQEPESILWCVRSDGQLLGLSYDEDQNILGWFRIKTRVGDVIESVETIPTSDGLDRVWISVARTVDGGTRRYFEYFDFGGFTTTSDVWRLDCAKYHENTALNIASVDYVFSYAVSDFFDVYLIVITTSTVHGLTTGDVVFVENTGDANFDGLLFSVEVIDTTSFRLRDLGTTDSFEVTSNSEDDTTSTGTILPQFSSFSGHDHLEGEDVTVLLDGYAVRDLTVESGSITLPEGTYGSYAIVGLPYTGKLQTMNIETNTRLGSSIGRSKKVKESSISFYQTVGGKAGSTESNVVEIDRRDIGELLGEGQSIESEPVPVKLTGNYRELTVWVIQDAPLPMTIQSITVKAEVTGT